MTSPFRETEFNGQRRGERHRNDPPPRGGAGSARLGTSVPAIKGKAVVTDEVLEDQIPADDEGDELADGDVAVDVGRAGLGHARSELGVAHG